VIPLVVRGPAQDHLPNAVGDLQEFVDADPFEVAGLAAEVASRPVPEPTCRIAATECGEERALLRIRFIRLDAVRADPPDRT